MKPRSSWIARSEKPAELAATIILACAQNREKLETLVDILSEHLKRDEFEHVYSVLD